MVQVSDCQLNNDIGDITHTGLVFDSQSQVLNISPIDIASIAHQLQIRRETIVDVLTLLAEYPGQAERSLLALRNCNGEALEKRPALNEA